MPIARWVGGKRRLADILIPRFRNTCYVEDFSRLLHSSSCGRRQKSRC
jgi:hypothetical protein